MKPKSIRLTAFLPASTILRLPALLVSGLLALAVGTAPLALAQGDAGCVRESTAEGPDAPETYSTEACPGPAVEPGVPLAHLELVRSEDGGYRVRLVAAVITRTAHRHGLAEFHIEGRTERAPVSGVALEPLASGSWREVDSAALSPAQFAGISGDVSVRFLGRRGTATALLPEAHIRAARAWLEGR